VWYDKGKAQFHVPPELKNCYHAEHMLLQLASPFIPLHHIKNGTLGVRGHTCAFPQDVASFAKTLPRLPRDTTVLKVLHSFQKEIGSTKQSVNKTFRVRKKVVLEALYWLKKHNYLYEHIEIDESNLDWIDGDEADLDYYVKEIVDDYDPTDVDDNDDKGPSVDQTTVPREEADEDVTAIGVVVEDSPLIQSENDRQVQQALQDVKEAKVNFPDIDASPISEWDKTQKIMCMAFPWLFPGGIGDVQDFPGKYMADWGSMMLYYEDGRFERDSMFCFFAQNYLIRRRNSASGRYFTENFHKNAPPNLDDLQESIRNGDTSFVNNLTYYSKRVKGSNPYWMAKRAELYSWIQHHADVGNGVPMFFITLSCAEYMWPDVIDLLRERMEMAGEDTSKVYLDSPGLVQLINDYSMVVQEYYQKRVEHWLDVVGKKLLGIEHYWVRYEFTPGRGQIHAHLLAISSDQYIFDFMHKDSEFENGKEVASKRLADWAEKRFGLSATVNDGFDDLSHKAIDSGVTMRFSNVPRCEKEKDIA
jgi:hypothetical protein